MLEYILNRQNQDQITTLRDLTKKFRKSLMQVSEQLDAGFDGYEVDIQGDISGETEVVLTALEDEPESDIEEELYDKEEDDLDIEAEEEWYDDSDEEEEDYDEEETSPFSTSVQEEMSDRDVYDTISFTGDLQMENTTNETETIVTADAPETVETPTDAVSLAVSALALAQQAVKEAKAKREAAMAEAKAQRETAKKLRDEAKAAKEAFKVQKDAINKETAETQRMAREAADAEAQKFAVEKAAALEAAHKDVDEATELLRLAELDAAPFIANIANIKAALDMATATLRTLTGAKKVKAPKAPRLDGSTAKRIMPASAYPDYTTEEAEAKFGTQYVSLVEVSNLFTSQDIPLSRLLKAIGGDGMKFEARTPYWTPFTLDGKRKRYLDSQVLNDVPVIKAEALGEEVAA